jgi:hypothetical protein
MMMPNKNYQRSQMKRIGFTLRLRTSHILKDSLVIVAAMCCMESCKKSADNNSSGNCDGTAKSFVVDVTPVMQASCAFDSDCHGSGSTSGPGPLLSYPEVFSARAIIRSAIVSGEMPKDGSITTSEKNAIICWIDNGALNN